MDINELSPSEVFSYFQEICAIPHGSGNTGMIADYCLEFAKLHGLNENIYTMVHLDSFVKPETIPYQYKVELLTTQYRSVPDIGGIFSNFAYGGILKHYRSADSQRPLNVGDGVLKNAYYGL